MTAHDDMMMMTRDYNDSHEEPILWHPQPWKGTTPSGSHTARTALTAQSLEEQQQQSQNNSHRPNEHDNDDDVSKLSMGTAPRSPTTPTVVVVGGVNLPVPTVIFMVGKHSSERPPQQDPDVREMARRRRRPRGSIRSYAIGTVVGQSSPIRHGNGGVSSSSSPWDFGQTVQANRKLETLLVAEDDPTTRRRRRVPPQLVGEILYALQVTCWRPLRRFVQQRCPTKQPSLRPSPHGCLV